MHYSWEGSTLALKAAFQDTEATAPLQYCIPLITLRDQV